MIEIGTDTEKSRYQRVIPNTYSYNSVATQILFPMPRESFNTAHVNLWNHTNKK